MKWYKKFKAGQKVKVVKKITTWQFDNCVGGQKGRGATWVGDMDKTIGKVFEIVGVNSDVGYRLGTKSCVKYDYDYYYSPESLEKENVKGKQLEFAFMQTNS